MPDLPTVLKGIVEQFNPSSVCVDWSSQGGGCINDSFQVTLEENGKRERYFIKTNRSHLLPMFKAEAAGLEALACTETIRVPEVKKVGVAQKTAYLILEWCELMSIRGDVAAELGRDLAQLHSCRGPYFGWTRDNTIGSTLQINQQQIDWIAFWKSNRLEHQLKLALSNRLNPAIHKAGLQLLEQCDALFEGYEPYPAPLHGDLWGGNAAAMSDGTPIIFDPAFYWGDRETDIAMTELFGGFAEAFYAAYNEVLPLDEGYQRRKYLYQLYHLLNHFNLFGAGYEGQVHSAIQESLNHLP